MHFMGGRESVGHESRSADLTYVYCLRDETRTFGAKRQCFPPRSVCITWRVVVGHESKILDVAFADRCVHRSQCGSPARAARMMNIPHDPPASLRMTHQCRKDHREVPVSGLWVRGRRRGVLPRQVAHAEVLAGGISGNRACGLTRMTLKATTFVNTYRLSLLTFEISHKTTHLTDKYGKVGLKYPIPRLYTNTHHVSFLSGTK